MKQRVFSLLVDNTSGVLSRIAGLFSRRGYSIDSITAGATANQAFTRITVVCRGDELILEQITNQLRKLVDVRDIKILKAEESVKRELDMNCKNLPLKSILFSGIVFKKKSTTKISISILLILLKL